MHKLNKPIRQPVKDDLPDISSHSEDGDWSSNIGNDDLWEGSSQTGGGDCLDEHSDFEMPYETAARPRRPSWNEDSENEVQRLPIKLLDGRIKNIGVKPRGKPKEYSGESDKVEALETSSPEPPEDTTPSRRFGRCSAVDLVATKSRKKRIHAAREHIASICQEIVGDPEDGVSYSNPVKIVIIHQSYSSSSRYFAVCIVLVWQRLHLHPSCKLSQMTQRSESLPCYPNWPSLRMSSPDTESVRLRNKKSLRRLGKPSQGFGNGNKVLSGFIRSTYNSLKQKSKVRFPASDFPGHAMISAVGKTELADVCLKCMCTLLVEVTHFNFRTNVISCIMGRLSRRSWDEVSFLVSSGFGVADNVLLLSGVRPLPRHLDKGLPGGRYWCRFVGSSSAS